MCLIVAMTPDRLIGKGNTMPWHLPADLAWFKKQTLGHILLMGKQTFLSIGKSLPGRETWVISGSLSPREDIRLFPSLDEAIKEIERRAPERFFVVGGGSIYRQTIAMADELLITQINASLEGDTYFPEFEPGEWELHSESFHPADEKNAYDLNFQHFRRKKNP